MLSVIVPVYNEESLIDELYNRLAASLPLITKDFEVIFVDDGSTDHSLMKLVSLNHLDKRFKTLVLSRNFGHQQAYTAGLESAKGDFIAMMDGDLQDPPELLQQMYKKINEEGFDIVYGKRNKRREGFFKALLIKSFHKVFKNILKMDEADNVGNFSMFKKNVLQTLLLFKENKRYLPGIRFFIGYKQGSVEYARDSRYSGKAKMSTSKLLNLAVDAIFSFSDFPIRLFFYIGLLGLLVCFAGFIYALISKFTGVAPYGWSSTVLAILLVSSFQTTFLGIIAEYVYRTYKETQKRPLFIVKEFIE